MGFFNSLKNGSNSPESGELLFKSSDHIRYQNGKNVSGHNYGCHRTVKIEKNLNGNEGYTVTIFNDDNPHPLWGTNVQMAPKQMRCARTSNDIVYLQGYGHDSMGNSFSNYAMTIRFSENIVHSCVLHMLDRGVDLEYLRDNSTEILDDRLNMLNHESRQLIHNILINAQSHPMFRCYKIIKDEVSYSDAGAIGLILESPSGASNLFIFYPACDGSGKIGSCAIYGHQLMGHKSSIEKSMSLFGLPVETINWDMGVEIFLNIILKNY